MPATLNFKHLTTENGLSQGVVDFMLKDSKGFMWFTSHDGINRFDGTTCLSNEQIGPGFTGGQQTKGLAEDDKGNIWIGSVQEMVKFSYSTGQFYKIVPDNLEQGTIRWINSFIMPGAYADGWLLVHRDNAPAFLYHTLTNKTRVIPNPAFGADGKMLKEKLPGVKTLMNGLHYLINDSSKVSDVMVEQDENGDYYWKEYKIFERKNLPGGGDAEVLIARDSILILSGSNGKIIKVNITTGERVVLTKKMKGKYPHSLFIDEQFNLWVAPESGGLLVYDLKTNKLTNSFTHDKNNDASLSKVTVSSILKANDNMLWLGVWGKGVDYTRLTDHGFSHHLTEADVGRFGISNFVRGIVQAKDGMFYANTQFGGIIQLDQQLNFRKIIANELSASIYMDQKKENIYFGDRVIYRYNLQSGKLMPINKLHRDFNTAFPTGAFYQFSDYDRNKILAAGILNVVAIDPKQQEISQLPGFSEVYNRQPIYAKQVKGGNIYVNTSTGGLLIFGWNGRKYEKIFTFPEKFTTKHIWEENDTTHWIGSTNGLYVFNPLTFNLKNHYTPENGLPNNVVYAMAPDTMGRLWVSTNKGLASLVKATGKWSTYKNFSGTQGNEYNSHTVVTAADGRIIFGGVNGLTAIRPWEVDTDYPFPTVQITAIKGDSSYNPYTYNRGAGPIAITAGDNTLEFDFIGIDYNDPSACKLRYRLKEADKDWVESSNPGKARYVKLAPGNYTFEVMATNANGDWSNDVRSVEIQLAAFWWQWKWLQALLIMVLIGTIILMARLQVKRSLFKKQVLLEKEISIIRERERITADLHDDVGATLSSLNIYGDLAHSIWEANPAKSKEMVSQIAGQSRELMLRMSDIIWSMKPEGSGGNGLTSRIKNFAHELLSSKGIEVNFTIDETIISSISNPMVRKNIILLIKEALNNAAKYSHAKKAGILLEKRAGMLILEITDDGKGFEPEMQKKGNGLENMANRCRQMGGNFCLESKPGEGTKVNCSIPIAIISYSAGK